MTIITDSELADLRALMEASFDTTATRQRAGTTTDRYGATVADWSNPAEATYPCRLVPAGTVERLADGRDVQIDQPTVRLPHDADVTATDRLVVDGVTYEADGPPVRRSSRIDAAVRLVEG